MTRVLRWGSAIAYIALLTTLLIRPMPPGFQPLFPQSDKVAHFVAIGLLSTMLLRAMTDPRAERLSRPAAISACVIAVAYAVAMEFVQAHFDRDFSVFDMLAGALGVVVLTPVYGMLRSRSIFLR